MTRTYRRFAFTSLPVAEALAFDRCPAAGTAECSPFRALARRQTLPKSKGWDRFVYILRPFFKRVAATPLISCA